MTVLAPPILCCLLLLIRCLLSEGQPFESFIIQQQEGRQQSYPVTVVSGHWFVSKSKHPPDFYKVWWRRSLSLKCPHMIFGEEAEVINSIQAIRANVSFPTMFVYRNLTRDMYPRFEGYSSSFVSAGVPSKGVAVIWLDKIFMLREAMRRNPFQSEWFVWNDAGNAAFRKGGSRPYFALPWPNPVALSYLPKDKFIYTASWFPWKEHSVAGTAFMYHQSIQTVLEERFMAAFHACLRSPGHWNKFSCGSDQIILSQVKQQHPAFFHQAGYGYGTLIKRLFSEEDPSSNITAFTDLCLEENGHVAALKALRLPSVQKACAGVWGSKPSAGKHSLRKKRASSGVDGGM